MRYETKRGRRSCSDKCPCLHHGKRGRTHIQSVYICVWRRKEVRQSYREIRQSKRNVIHERACFHRRVQTEGETVETFIRNLYELAEHCEFGTQRDEQIRNRIVIRILDKSLSQKLQMKSDLRVRSFGVIRVRISDPRSVWICLDHGASKEPANP